MARWRGASAVRAALPVIGCALVIAPHAAGAGALPATAAVEEPPPALISVQQLGGPGNGETLVVDGTDASETITVTGSGTTWTFTNARVADSQGTWDVSEASYCEHTDDPTVVTCEVVDALALGIYLHRSAVTPGDRVDLLFTPDPEPQLWVDGGAGPDTLDATSYPGNTFFQGQRGDDVMYGGPGSNGFEGASGDDWASGGGSGEGVVGMNGDDVLWGDAPAGSPPVEASGDAIYGGFGDDILHGQGGNDSMRGWGGADVATGGPGDDGFVAGTGADLFDSGSGDDSVSPGPGRDVASLGRGSDSSYSENDGVDTIDCGAGPDVYRADERDHITHCERFHHY